MAEHQAEASPRRRVLKIISLTVCGALVTALAGCAQGSTTESWKKPDWMRSKRGSNGNGAGRR